MTQRANRRVSRIGGPAGPAERFPYRIEVWHAADSERVERVLALAYNAVLARAIFEAAQREYPERRITLRRGSRMLADSAALVPPRQPEPPVARS